MTVTVGNDHSGQVLGAEKATKRCEWNACTPSVTIFKPECLKRKKEEKERECVYVCVNVYYRSR